MRCSALAHTETESASISVRIAETLRPLLGAGGLRKVVTCELTMANQMKPKERKGIKMLKKAKGIKVTAYETGINYREDDTGFESPFIVLVIDDPKKEYYDFILTARSIGHYVSMDGHMKEYGLEEGLELAEANLLDGNMYIDMYYKELYEDELVAEIEMLWDSRKMAFARERWEEERNGK